MIIYATIVLIKGKEKFHKKVWKWLKDIIDAFFGIG